MLINKTKFMARRWRRLSAQGAWACGERWRSGVQGPRRKPFEIFLMCAEQFVRMFCLEGKNAINVFRVH